MRKSSDEQKKWGEFREYFERFVVNDINKSLDVGIEVGTVILTVIGIDCLSGYYAGKPTEKSLFVAFVNDFMPQYNAYALDIYNLVRNGLAHDYIVKTNTTTKRTFGFTRDGGESHLVQDTANPNKIIINRVAFAKDFLAAQCNYFVRVENEQALWDRAISRLNDRGFLSVLGGDDAPSPPTISKVANVGTSISTQQYSTGVKSPFNPLFGKPDDKP